MERANRQRDFGLDLIRAMAGVLTVSVHFFLNNAFYDTPVAGKTMLAACVVRMMCMTCVPLFLLLTGYTCVNRKWSKGYYRKLLPILLTYLLAGTMCMVFRQIVRENGFTLVEAWKEYFTFNASPYGWYIEMYIGLFLLSPFFNAAWHALEDGGKKALVITLVCLTALPGLPNQFLPLLPAWWEGIYPLTYYALGAWLREHPIRLKGWQLLAGFFGTAALMGLKGYFAAGGGAYPWIPEDQWGSYALTIQSLCLFSCLIRAKGERAPAPVRAGVARMSKLTLGVYLVSFIPDWLIYGRLGEVATQVHRRLFCMPLVVPVVIICSLLLAQLVDWGVAALMKLIPTKTKNAQES